MPQSYRKTFTTAVLEPYRSPLDEQSIYKGIPMKYLDLVKSNYPGRFRYRYRGQSVKGVYNRDQSYCIQSMADSFAIYRR